MDDPTSPYPGATERVMTKRQKKAEKKAIKKAKDIARKQAKIDKKKNTSIQRSGYKCTCGVLKYFNCVMPDYHEDHCVIHKQLKKEKAHAV